MSSIVILFYILLNYAKTKQRLVNNNREFQMKTVPFITIKIKMNILKIRFSYIFGVSQPFSLLCFALSSAMKAG